MCSHLQPRSNCKSLEGQLQAPDQLESQAQIVMLPTINMAAAQADLSSSSNGSESGSGWVKTLTVKPTTGQLPGHFVQLATQDGKKIAIDDLQKVSCYKDWSYNRILDAEDEEDFKDQLDTG